MTMADIVVAFLPYMRLTAMISACFITWYPLGKIKNLPACMNGLFRKILLLQEDKIVEYV